MQMQGVSRILDVMRIGWEFIVAHQLEVQLLVLIGLSGLLGYLMWRRRSNTLSVLVERKFAEYKGKLRQRLSLSERLSSKGFTIAAFFLPLLISGVVGALGLMFGKEENNAQDMERFLGTLHACGTIVASFTVLLITIIVFTVTINSAYVVKASSLFKFYFQRLYFKPVLAFAAGTVIACLINSIVINHFHSWPLVTVTIIVFLGCSVIALDLVVLFTAIRVLVRSAISEFLAESYVTEHRNSLLAHVKRTLAQTMFVESLRELGFLWTPLEWYEGTERVEYTVKGRARFVNDVYFGRLEKLARKWELKAIESDERQIYATIVDNPPSIRIWPGEKLPEKDERCTAMYVKDKELDSRAQRIFDKAVVCGKKDNWNIPPVQWSEISHLLKTFIEEKDIGGVKSVLEAFRSIAGDYLECRREIEWPHGIQTLDEEIMSTYRAPTLRNLDFLSFIRFAIRNEDEECLDEISRFLYGMAYTAFEFESEQYFDEVLVRLNWLYELSRGSERLAERAAANVVRYYKYVGNIFNGHVYKDENNPDLYNHIFPFVERYLKNILEAMREAAKHNDSNTFEKLLKLMNSLLGHHISDDVREQYYYNYKKKKPELLEVQLKIRDVKLLSNLVLSAWLYRGANNGGDNDEKTITLFIHKVLDYILNFQELIEIYLYVNRLGSYGTNLGYDWWELSEKEPGESLEGSAFENWIQPFWVIVALVRAASKPKIDLKRIRLLSAFRDYHYERLENGIKTILDTKDKYKWFAEDVDLDSGREKLLEIFQEIKELQKKKDFSELISAPISQKKVDKFKKDCLKGYLGERKITDLVKEFKCQTKKEVVSWSGKASVVGVSDKEEFIEDWHVGYGGREANGDFLGQVETRDFSCWIEEKLPELGTVNNFTELPSRVKEVADKLRKEGFKPTVVLIPKDHRYQDTFTSAPDWERMPEYMKNDLPEWVAEFDDMQVFIWPRREQECIAVIDIDKFLAVEEESIGTYAPLEIQLNEINEERMRELLEKKNNSRNKQCQKEFKASGCDVASFAKIKLDLKVTANVRLGIIESGAGSKLTLDENKIGVVCDKQKKICHRLDCEEVNEISTEHKKLYKTAELAVRGYRYQPCEKCRPLLGTY